MTASVGIVMLVHTALHRAEQVARFWAAGGCPVVIHVDRKVSRQAYTRFAESLSDLPRVEFSRRHRCEWGTWGIVAGTQDAAEQVLRRYPEVRHVMLTSGSCLPLRPVAELEHYLAERPRTDFIESATTSDVAWTVGGLDKERFTLRFPFSWRSQRLLFDAYVNLQRRLKVRRRIPRGLVPHLGSQWWCLSRQTLSAILEDPNRKAYDRYFRRVWIPDESYFQTLARLWSVNVESRSLTLSKFDFQGKPHIFYDDHLQLLRRSDCFVARKIWPHAEGLYQAFLAEGDNRLKRTEPNPGKIDRIFGKAVERRTRGRPGLYMQSRFPRKGWENGVTAGRYSVFQGFSELFLDFEDWLARATDITVHGHLFAPDRAEFAGGARVWHGAMSDTASLRDADPRAFLANLIWNTRGTRQCWQFGPGDTQTVLPHLLRDTNAEIAVISGAWAVPLFRSNANFAEIRARAARLQKIEAAALQEMRATQTKARVRIWTMADFIAAPMEPLQQILEDMGARPRRITEAPRMAPLDGFGKFLQNLKNQGMHPHLMGDFPVERDAPTRDDPQSKPYLIKK